MPNGSATILNASAANESSLGPRVDRLVAAHVGALGGRDVERRRQVVDDGVEHRLDALVLERRAAQHRHEVEGERAGADGALDVGLGDVVAGEVLLHQLVVAAGDRLEHLLAELVGLIDHVGRDVDLVPLGAELLVVPDEGLHLHQVDEADERLRRFGPARADRELQDGRGRVEAFLDHPHRAVEVGADAIHLVDEAEPRDVVLVGLPPHRLGLRFDTGDRVEHGDGAVEHAQRPLDLDREVDVAGRVDDVDPVVVPDAGRGGRRDRDPALLLLGHVVHRGGAVVDLADLVALPGVVEDALGRGGLARVDVGHDADVAGALEGELSLGHRRVNFRVSNRVAGGGNQVVRWDDRATGTAIQCIGDVFD